MRTVEEIEKEFDESCKEFWECINSDSSPEVLILATKRKIDLITELKQALEAEAEAEVARLHELVKRWIIPSLPKEEEYAND